MIENKCFKYVGKVEPVKAKDIACSYFGLGFEKLDRAVFDPEKAYGKIAELGVKQIRLQSGWQRTERSPGVYDFSWLDDIADKLISLGMEPWICLCYGNELYTEAAKNVFGAVGCPPIATPEERTAWYNYVTACTAHFQGRIRWYEVWNEPDGIWCWKHGVSGTEYGEFIKQTAAAVRAGDCSAKVMGGSSCMTDLAWLNDMLATGCGSVMDAFSYHAYSMDETEIPQRLDAFRAIFEARELPDMPFIQGETGCPSRDDGFGALCNYAWTQEKQAKCMLRSSFMHLSQNILFSSWFSALDMIEALNGTNDNKGSYQDYGYFGLLAADFDENGFSVGTYAPKKSYYAMQVMTSVFRNCPQICNLPALYKWGHDISPRTHQPIQRFNHLKTVGFKRPNGSCALVYWKMSDLMTESVDAYTALQTFCKGKIRLVDLMDGSIYEPDERIVTGGGNGMRWLNDLPLRDYPLALVFGDFF